MIKGNVSAVCRESCRFLSSSFPLASAYSSCRHIHIHRENELRHFLDIIRVEQFSNTSAPTFHLLIIVCIACAFTHTHLTHSCTHHSGKEGFGVSASGCCMQLCACACLHVTASFMRTRADNTLHNSRDASARARKTHAMNQLNQHERVPVSLVHASIVCV